MKIHREGFKTIYISTALLLILIWFTRFLIKESAIMTDIIIISFTMVYIWIISFFRYPKREIAKDDNNIICSADGRVVAIEEVYEKEYFKANRLQVSVFMSPINIHANWFPISGRIKYKKYHPGKHLIAYNPKSSFENEMTSIVVEKPITVDGEKHNKEILIRQIAGVMARRIVCYADLGDDVLQGDELGFIKFGSRVDILLPPDSKIQVKLNQKVKGKKTIIAKFK